MSDLPSLNMLYQQKQAKVASLNEKKNNVSGEVNTLNSDTSAAKVTLDGSQASLADATNALSNFTIPDIIDKPDRASFTSMDSQTGEEVFDSAAYEAENEKYLASVRAHDEAVKQKEELERSVQQKTAEVSGAEAKVSDLTAATQAKEGELVSIGNDINVSMSELEDLSSQISVLQAEQVKKEEVPETKDVKAAEDVEKAEAEAETKPKEDITVDVPVQNNKGWEYYAKLELEAEHEGEEGYKPTAAELNAKSKEIMQRNIENGNVNKKGDLVVGTPQDPKYVTLNGEIDVSGLQSTEQALVKYNQGQEILAEEARLKAEEEARVKAEKEQKEQEAAIKKGKKEAEASLKKELSGMSEADVKKMLSAQDMSDDEINKAINEVMGDLSKATTVADKTGQDIGKITGRLAKKYGAKNAQKILGRICNTAAKKAGKAIPGMNVAMAGYGVYKVANGDMKGLYDIADVAVSYIPVVGTAVSLIGTENIVNFFDFREDLKRPDAIARYDALAMSL